MASRTVTFASVASSTATAPASWTSDTFDSDTLLSYFLRPYLEVHRLSAPSKRPAYFLWFAIAAIFIIWSIENLLTRKHPGSFGAARDKISMRRFCFTLGKAKKPKPGQKAAVKRLWTTATVAQLVSMVGMLVGITAACFWGDDYLNPSTCLFGGWCPGQSENAMPPSSTYTSRAKRWTTPEVEIPAFAPVPISRGPHNKLRRHSLKRTMPIAPRGELNPNGYAPMNDPLLAGYNHAIHRTLWTSSARIGMIAFALCPLVVSLALKIFPFAAFSVPFLMAYEFDKTIIYHRWIGIIIWILSTAHAATWTLQLVRDKDPFGKPVLYDMIYYWHFYGAIAGYVALTLMLVLSFGALRRRYYEFFYISHMFLGVVFLVGCMLHYPPLKTYLIIALGLWGCDRLARLVWWFYINGYFDGLNSSEGQSMKLTKLHNKMNMTRKISAPEKPYLNSFPATPVTSSVLIEKPRVSSMPLNKGTRPPPIALYQVDSPQHYGSPFNDSSDAKYPPSSPSYSSLSTPPLYVAASDQERPTPPPGFALAQLLPGKNIRLTIRVPRLVHWRTGQYTSLTIPSVNKFQGHPFTIANTDERQIRSVNQVGSEIVLVVGVRNGFTKRLWDEIVKRRKVFGPAAAASSGGILLRAQVSQPTGTAGRARLDDFESVLIICGGTGISFGMAIMEHVCMSMSTRDADKAGTGKKKHCKTQRVRFVWILREFAHLSWVAPAVRRCLDMCPPSRIRIDFFVTRDTRAVTPAPAMGQLPPADEGDLVPPVAAQRRRHESDDSHFSEDEDHPIFNKKATPVIQPEPSQALDYVLFGGEDEEQTAAESQWSKKVQQEGKLRRAKSRKAFTGKRQRPQRFGGADDKTPTSSPLRSRFSQGDLKLPQQDTINAPPLPRSTSDDLIDSYYSLDADESTDGSVYLEKSGLFSQTQETLASVKTHRTEASYSSRKGLLDQSTAAHASPFRDEAEDLFLDVSDAEMEDLNIISELARTGHPDIPKIMDEEQERASGRLLVGCCGPVKLNITVRGLVADRISPRRVAKGDLRGSLALSIEDFE